MPLLGVTIHKTVGGSVQQINKIVCFRGVIDASYSFEGLPRPGGQKLVWKNTPQGPTQR